MKVKIFASDVRRKDNDLSLLESEINLWLSANPEITVHTVILSPLEQSLVCVVTYLEEGQGRSFTFAVKVPLEEEPEFDEELPETVDKPN